MTSATPLVVESSLAEGELGHFLCAAVLKTLHSEGRLLVFRAPHPHPLCPEVAFENFDSAPWLKIGEDRWDSWSSEVVMLCYERLRAFQVHDLHLLDLWIRAFCGESKDFWEMHRLCVSRQVMASLVERGGQPLRALKIS